MDELPHNVGAAPAAPRVNMPIAPPLMSPPAPPVVTLPSAAPPAPPVAIPPSVPKIRPSVFSPSEHKLQPSGLRPLGPPSGELARTSKVPSVPVLFDNEPQVADEEAPVASGNDYPEILFEPLHVFDPLCLKWKLGNLSTMAGASVDVAPLPRAEAPAPAPAPAPQHMAAAPAPVSHIPMQPSQQVIPSSARQSRGYLRLLGLLFNGSPWECSIPFADMSRPGGVIIGRDPAYCHVVLAEGSISRRHACLELTNEGVVVSDQQSTNGTYLNGRRLESYERQVSLRDGNILGLGDITLRVEIMSPTAAPYMPM